MLFLRVLPLPMLFMLQGSSILARAFPTTTSDVDLSSPFPFNTATNGWPPEPFRFPLPDYEGGYLVLHAYGPSGSPKDRPVLLSLLEMATQANIVTPQGYLSPNVDVNIPDTGVFLRIRGTAPPGFPSLSTKLALGTLSSLKSLVRRYEPIEMLIDVHDGFLDYGPWGIMLRSSRSLYNGTDRQ